MRITQGYVSKSVMDFPFHQIYELDDYNNVQYPAVFFGMYRFEDFCLADSHLERSKPLIFWTGQDALNERTWPKQIGLNFTAHPKVKEHFLKLGYGCTLVKPSTFLNTIQPQRLGTKIYAYCPASAPEYHGSLILEQLRGAGYDIIVGDGMHSQSNWRSGLCNDYYNQAFIGLCLSEFAGGGTSIIEMGLRGLRVVTNVFNLPNCVPWNSLEDIMLAIELETKRIGSVNRGLAEHVWQNLDHKHEWLEL